MGLSLDRRDMVVARCWTTMDCGRNCVSSKRFGRPRDSNPHGDRPIITEATYLRTTSLESVQRQLPLFRHMEVSEEVFRRNLTEFIRTRQLLNHLPLFSHDRQYPLDFHRPRKIWSVIDQRVISIQAQY
ncbi:hypothetical protein TNCV_2599641 [Trichonephila clavipes]|nr:hypothetical protein TNCV_2599641 [Trichonephila clavipes]